MFPQGEIMRANEVIEQTMHLIQSLETQLLSRIQTGALTNILPYGVTVDINTLRGAVWKHMGQ